MLPPQKPPLPWVPNCCIVLGVCLVLLGAGVPHAFANAELRELYRGTRAQAMGNAFTAVADDEEAIFMNPAGLAGVEKFRMNWLTGDFDISDEAIYTAMENSTSTTTLGSSFSASNVNKLQGKNIYGRYQSTPGFVMKNFGVSAILDGQAALRTKNLALPQVELGYQFTNGVQLATGFSVIQGRRAAKHNDIRVGIAAKYLFRRGGYHLLTPTQLVDLNKDTVSNMTGEYVVGFGGDLGVQYIRMINPSLKASLGSAWTDIGDTKFGPLQDPVRNNLSIGTALTYDGGRYKIIVSYDHRHLLADQEFKKKSHFGMELTLPILSLQAGLNQTNVTYGAIVDLKVARVSFATYSEEIGTYAGQDSEKRYLLSFQVRLGI